MHSFNKEIGSLGEDLAVDFLEKLGYEIQNRNFRSRFGEIDIIAKDENYTVFVEVKTRYTSVYGTPGEAVNYNKICKLYKTAEYYILKNEKNSKNYFRFDVIEICIDYDNNSRNIRLIKNAFQL